MRLLARYLLLSSLSLSGGLLALPARAQQPGTYVVQGQDARLAGQSLYLLAASRPSHEQPWPVLDSTRADASGRFVLRGRVPAGDVYHLRVGHQSLFYPVPLTGQAEQLQVLVEDAPRRTPVPYQLRLRGTPALDLLQATQLATAPSGTVSSPGQRRRLAALLRNNAASPLAPYLAYRYLLPDPTSRPLLDSLADRFSREQPASPYLPRLQATPGETPLALGQPAPDFTLLDAQGNALTLSSLRGRYVLVDFWASWCKPCRAENPTLRAAYQRFHDQRNGLIIVSVSVDESAAAWQRAVAEEALPWPQVRTAGGLRGPVGRAYQLVGVPATFLLDPAGRLLTTEVRGQALAKQLAHYLR